MSDGGRGVYIEGERSGKQEENEHIYIYLMLREKYSKREGTT